MFHFFYGLLAQACSLFAYSGCTAYRWLPITDTVGSKKAIPEGRTTKNEHSSAISWPARVTSVMLNHASPSGSVIVSNTSCESVLLVESTSRPFGVPGRTAHPGTFWNGSTEYRTCPISPKSTLP